MFHPWHVHRREFHWSSSWRVMQSEKGTGRNWCKWQKWRQPFAWAKSKWSVMRPLWEPMWKMVVQWLWLRKILTSRRWHWMQFLLCSCIAFLMKSMSWWWPMLCGIAVLTDVDLPDVFGQVLFECLCDKTCFIRGTKWVEDRKWTCEGAFCSDFTLPNQFASSTSSWRPPCQIDSTWRNMPLGLKPWPLCINLAGYPFLGNPSDIWIPQSVVLASATILQGTRANLQIQEAVYSMYWQWDGDGLRTCWHLSTLVCVPVISGYVLLPNEEMQLGSRSPEWSRYHSYLPWPGSRHWTTTCWRSSQWALPSMHWSCEHLRSANLEGERERETSVLEDLHETGGSLFMFLMSFRFFTWNLALRLDTIKRWEKNLSVVSEADSRELLLESQVAAVLEHLAPGFWRLDGTSAEPGWDVFLRSASLLP